MFSFAGSHILLEKLRKYKPKIAVFNGKLIYEVFSGKKEFGFGRQPNLVDGTNTVKQPLYIYCFPFCRTKIQMPFKRPLKIFQKTRIYFTHCTEC